MMEKDKYQKKYLAHQKRKKQILIKIMKERHSNRMFSDKSVRRQDIKQLKQAVSFCPTSCNRKAISISVIENKDQKALLGGLLVGGVGWIYRSPIILLLFADPQAYKAGDEIKYMPYLDAGVAVQQLYLLATSLGLHCSYVNPNIREFNKKHFKSVFGKNIFCGAFAIGYPYEKK